MNKRGFTLIEIVMVLVLLGILAAVAVPKYFDLQLQAEKQAAKAIAAEYQAQINGKFADQILDNKSCEDARKEAIEEANKIEFTADNGFTFVKINKDTTAAKETLTIKNRANEELVAAPIALPVCKTAVGG